MSRHTSLLILATIELSYFIQATAQAQTLPPPADSLGPKQSTPQPIPEPPVFKLPPIDPLPENPAQQLPKPNGDRLNIPLPITIKDFEILGNERFSDAMLIQAIEKKIGPFRGQSLSFGQLLQAADAVTQYYLDRKYVTTGAYISAKPEAQAKLKDGVVTIEVLEGKLGEIRVRFPQGKRQRLSDRYVENRIRSAVGNPLNIEELRSSLQILTLNPLLKKIKASLTPEAEAGKSSLTIDLEEAPSMSADAILDNNNSPSVGSFRRQLQFTQGNLTGLGDALTIAYGNSNGSNTGTASYSLPINPKGGTLALNLGLSKSRIIEAPFNVLDIDANSQSYELSYRQPLVLKPNREFAIGATLSRRISEATLLDGLVPFPSIGAEEDGKTRLMALRLFQDGTWRGPTSLLAVRSQFSLGLGTLGATVNERGPDSRFISWLGQAQWVKQLGRETQLIVRTDLQFADRNLLPSERLGLGGQTSIRGYRQDALLTDGGLFASAELRIPIIKSYQSRFLFQVAPFIDVGKGWNLGDDNPSPETATLASVGLGLRLQASDRFSARLDWGHPLIKLSDSISGGKKSWQENGIYFSMVYKLF
jgi:hemolysin activation/secretion protein